MEIQVLAEKLIATRSRVGELQAELSLAESDLRTLEEEFCKTVPLFGCPLLFTVDGKPVVFTVDQDWYESAFPVRVQCPSPIEAVMHTQEVDSIPF